MNDDINKAGRPYLFRFRKDTDRTIEEIAENYIFFPNRESLNDPFDASPSLVYLTNKPKDVSNLYNLVLKSIPVKKAKEFVEANYDHIKFQEFAKEKVKDFILQFGIACFSTHYLNLPLWANYANNHKGLCLQFNIDFDKDFFSSIGLVKYVDELKKIEFSPFDEESATDMIFFRKANNWSHENEIRLVKEVKGKLNYKRKALRNVIIGFNSENTFTNKVINAVADNYDDVGVYKMKMPTEINKTSLIKLF
jgi:hypothetical protein